MAATTTITPNVSFNRKLFVGLILAATLIPVMILPMFVQAKASNIITLTQIVMLTEFLGGEGHVASTLFLYTDPKLRDFFATRKRRYLYVPILLCLTSALAFASLPEIVTSYLLLGYILWQLYHYQRQNHGILSFFCAATESVGVSQLERTILNLGLLAGIFGMFRVSLMTQVGIVKPFVDFLYLSGIDLIIAVAVLILAAAITQPQLRQNRLRLLFLVLGGLFYLPTFLFFEPTAAIMGYAYAHGFQYLIFMYFIADSNHHTTHSGRMVGLIACTILGGLVLSLTSFFPPVNWVGKAAMGARLGFVMAHFVVDADVWKLREPFQRRYLGAAFDFVFAKTK